MVLETDIRRKWSRRKWEAAVIAGDMVNPVTIAKGNNNENYTHLVNFCKIHSAGPPVARMKSFKLKNDLSYLAKRAGVSSFNARPYVSEVTPKNAPEVDRPKPVTLNHAARNVRNFRPHHFDKTSTPLRFYCADWGIFPVFKKWN